MVRDGKCEFAVDKCLDCTTLKWNLRSSDYKVISNSRVVHGKRWEETFE